HTRFSRDWSSDVCSSDLSRIPRVLGSRAEARSGSRAAGEAVSRRRVSAPPASRPSRASGCGARGHARQPGRGALPSARTGGERRAASHRVPARHDPRTARGSAEAAGGGPARAHSGCVVSAAGDRAHAALDSGRGGGSLRLGGRVLARSPTLDRVSDGIRVAAWRRRPSGSAARRDGALPEIRQAHLGVAVGGAGALHLEETERAATAERRAVRPRSRVARARRPNRDARELSPGHGAPRALAGLAGRAHRRARAAPRGPRRGKAPGCLAFGGPPCRAETERATVRAAPASRRPGGGAREHRSAADVAHFDARERTRPLLAKLGVAILAALPHARDERRELGVARAAAQERPEILTESGEEARVQSALRGEAKPRAPAAERLGHARDDAEFSRAVSVAIATSDLAHAGRRQGLERKRAR